MRISDWSSDVCSSDLCAPSGRIQEKSLDILYKMVIGIYEAIRRASGCQEGEILMSFERALCGLGATVSLAALLASATPALAQAAAPAGEAVQEARPSDAAAGGIRSEEHTSELQSLMRISYAVFCL